ncbi:MAG: hypothetical protein RIR66_777 [Actinomycetota bacterium]|jgi:hypothetical protein
MTFALTVDRALFEKNINSVIDEFKKVDAQVIPVIKGNGYGFTRRTLSHESTKLGVNRIAVGTVFELDQALTDFGNEIIVLEPFNPNDQATVKAWQHATKNNAHRIIAVIAGSHFAQAASAGIKFALVEGKTSTHRFGANPNEILGLINGDQHNIQIVGLNLHLPIVEPENLNKKYFDNSARINNKKISPRLNEILSWINSIAPRVNQMGWPLKLNLSHVSTKDVSQILDFASENNLNIEVSVRLGTSLWLGSQKCLQVTGTVLEIHELTGDHEHVGYRQVDGHGHARLLVVSGGTAHGVALAAPASRTTLRSKAIALSEGISESLGKVRSPFKLGKKNLPFAEPPHMHVSLLWCEDRKVNVGDQLECTVRNTTATFDVINFR